MSNNPDKLYNLYGIIKIKQYYHTVFIDIKKID